MKNIIEKTLNNLRLTKDEALILYNNSDLNFLGYISNEIRKKRTDFNIVTFVIDRNINYTDICVSGCKFCAFYKAPESKEGYVLSFEELDEKIQEAKELGGTQILLQGGLHPELPLSFYEEMLSFIKSKGMRCHAFSPPEIIHLAKLNDLTIKEVLERLIKAGLDSIPGGGAEILSDRVRTILSPNKANTEEWLFVMETAHKLGLKTTATMMFGHIETLEERIEHLNLLRELQDRTNGFTAFIPWSFQPKNTQIEKETASAFEYLKILAISRIFLDNFDNIQVSWVTQGYKMAQVALYFGANDFGSAMIEENVVAAAGVKYRLSVDEINKHIKNAGFIPKQRKMDYTLI
jgi:cyclic dehypoxanthinyl futalosine synthase